MNPIRVNTDGIRIHTDEEFGSMRKSCLLATKTLDMIGEYVIPGVSTNELDKICHEFMFPFYHFLILQFVFWIKNVWRH